MAAYGVVLVFAAVCQLGQAVVLSGDSSTLLQVGTKVNLPKVHDHTPSAEDLIGEKTTRVDLIQIFTNTIEGFNKTHGAAASEEALPYVAPKWCKEKLSLVRKARNATMEADNAKKWALAKEKELKAAGEEVPKWMQKIVKEESHKGFLEWAALKYGTMSDADEEVPKWLVDVISNEVRETHRWAACKKAELEKKGQTVPQWMTDQAVEAIEEAAQAEQRSLKERMRRARLRRATRNAAVSHMRIAGEEEQQDPPNADDETWLREMAWLKKVEELLCPVLEYQDPEEEEKTRIVCDDKMRAFATDFEAAGEFGKAKLLRDYVAANELEFGPSQ